MKKILFLIALAYSLCGFSLYDEDPFLLKVRQNFMTRAKMQPQEKVYLHTDREQYIVGDTVWFRAYLVDMLTNMKSNYSQYVYVELTNRQDSVIKRVKVTCRDSIFSGYMDIPVVSRGEYILRAFSYWMQNAGKDYLFEKKIKITNLEDFRVNTRVTYTEEKERSIAHIRFTNAAGSAFDKVYICYQVNKKGKNGKMLIQRTDTRGEIQVEFDSKESPDEIYVKFDEKDSPFSFERHIHISPRVKDFNISFFPEGGHLLSGNMQNIAFKAIGNDGLSVDVMGYIYDDTDEIVGMFNTVHRGMGGFALDVKPGKRYYAVVTTADSSQKKVELPEVRRDAIGLKVKKVDSLLLYQVMLGDSARQPEDLCFLAHSRGVVLAFGRLNGRSIGRLDWEKLPEGILNLVLMDSKYNVYSQRLCFIRKKERPELYIEPDKKSYEARDLVKLNLHLSVDTGRFNPGSFSIAVTDDGKVKQDSLADNIQSNLLLTSDLKGYIEDPGYYFREVNLTTDRCLDILMMTQGWTRFDVAQIARGEYEDTPYYMEQGQAVSGKVKNFWGKDAQKAQLILFSNSGLFKMVDADTAGRFMVDGISYPDGTQFLLQAQNRKGRRRVEVIVDEDIFIAPENRFPYKRENEEAKDDDFYLKRDYYYVNGEKIYVLDEVVIKRKKPKKVPSFYDNMATYHLDSVKIASMKDLRIEDILQEMPGITVVDDNVTRYGKTLHLRVNDFPEDMEYIRLLPVEYLLSISYIEEMQSKVLFGDSAANGALIITMNPIYRDKPRLNMSVISPLGYQRAAAFYIPRYEVDSVRLARKDSVDDRHTIYWNPNVKIDSSGSTTLSFSTADEYNTYTIILEGILSDGTICRQEKKITLKLP